MIVQQVAFRGDGGIEIVYAEDRDLSEDYGIFRTLIFNSELVRVPAAECLEAVEELLDAVLLHIRNPTAKIDERQQEDEDDE